MSRVDSLLPPQVPGAPLLDAIHLTPRQAQAFVRLVEMAADVRRRFQLFVWLQSQVAVLLPHVLAVCGTYRRQTRQLHYDVFNSVAVDRAALDAVGAVDSPLMARAAELWVEGRGLPLLLSLRDAQAWRGIDLVGELQHAGMQQVMVHGVARPERPHEIETLFLLGDTAPEPSADAAHLLDLVLPHLHATLLRSQSLERELGHTPPRVAPSLPARLVQSVTAREVQILEWVREGKSNQAIGELLGISALTVKNHIQKVMRKLGASNRAHAVTLAARLRVLPGGPAGDGAEPGRPGRG